MNSEPKLIKATVIGFSRDNCKKCRGTGRIGWDAKYRDMAHIIVCPCVEFFDLEVVKKSWEKDSQEEAKDAVQVQ